MKKRKSEQSPNYEKKHKVELKTKILNFCSDINERFGLSTKDKITEANLADFINILNHQPITNVETNDLYVLHYLAQDYSNEKNNFEFAKYFIENGVEIDKRNNAGHTPLAYSAINEKLDFINLLINNKANVNSQNLHGNSILHNVIKQGDNCRPVIEKLIAAGANIELQNDKNQTPVEYAFEFRKSSALLSLLEHGAKITDKMNDDIYRIDPLNDSHKNCQNLVYLATTAWDLLTTEEAEMPIKVSKETYNRYAELVSCNSTIIRQIAHNIIISSPKELLLERLAHFQENLKPMNATTVVPVELFIDPAQSLLSKDTVFLGDFDDF